MCLQCRRPRFDPWVGKILQRRERLSIYSSIWPGEFHGPYSPSCRRVRHDWATFTLTLVFLSELRAGFQGYLENSWIHRILKFFYLDTGRFQIVLLLTDKTEDDLNWKLDINQECLNFSLQNENIFVWGTLYFSQPKDGNRFHIQKIKILYFKAVTWFSKAIWKRYFRDSTGRKIFQVSSCICLGTFLSICLSKNKTCYENPVHKV